MLKGKWKGLFLREKLLMISGMLVILSIPLSLITLYCISVAITLFTAIVFYNLYKNIQSINSINLKVNNLEKIQLPLIGIAVSTIIVFILIIFLWITV